MVRFGSLRTRIIVLTTIPLSALLIATLYFTNHTATEAVHRSIREGLSDAGTVFTRLLSAQGNELLNAASITANDPRFFATFSIPTEERGEEFEPTVEGVAKDFLWITKADFLEVFDVQGNFIAGASRDIVDSRALSRTGVGGLQEAAKGKPVTDLYQRGRHLVVAASAPVRVGSELEAVVRIGRFLDREFVQDIHRLTSAEVTLVNGATEFATTLPPLGREVRADPWAKHDKAPIALGQESAAISQAFTMRRGKVEYITVNVHLTGRDQLAGFDAYLSRAVDSELAPVARLEKRLLLSGVAAIAITFLLASFLAARVTGRLKMIVRASEEIEKGNYDVPLEVQGGDEVAHLAENFLSMKQSLKSHVNRLENLDQMKSNFIALAGHELRTPLTIISGFNELIVSGALGELPKEVEENMLITQQHLTELNLLVENMLDISRSEQGMLDYDFAVTNLATLIRDALATRSSSFSERNLRADFTEPEAEVWLSIDRKRFRQAFLNIIDNAIRFTPDGGKIRVSLECDGEVTSLSVRDTGIGIPPNQLDFVFEKINPGGNILNHSSGRAEFGSRGLGLGLALCRAIVEGHGGSIEVKSVLGMGSEFIVVIPGRRVEPPHEPSNQKETPAVFRSPEASGKNEEMAK